MFFVYIILDINWIWNTYLKYNITVYNRLREQYYVNNGNNRWNAIRCRSCHIKRARIHLPFIPSFYIHRGVDHAIASTKISHIIHKINRLFSHYRISCPRINAHTQQVVKYDFSNQRCMYYKHQWHYKINTSHAKSELHQRQTCKTNAFIISCIYNNSKHFNKILRAMLHHKLLLDYERTFE